MSNIRFESYTNFTEIRLGQRFLKSPSSALPSLARLQENLKTVAVLSSDVKSTTEASQSRFTRLEAG